MNTSVDKRTNRHLSESALIRHQASLEACSGCVEHFTAEAKKREDQNKKFAVVIRHYEDKIDNIKIPAGGIFSPDPQVKKALATLRNEVEMAQEIIRDHKNMISGNKVLIGICKRQALIYQRKYENQKRILSVKRPK